MNINTTAQQQMLNDNQRVNDRMSHSITRVTTGERANSVQDDPVLWEKVEHHKTIVSNLQGYTSNLDRAASTVRIALESMSVAHAHMEQAEAQLNIALQAAPGSNERSNALHAYNGLVDLVDDANNTPDPDASRLLQDPSANPAAGNVNVRAGEDQYSITLYAREIHTGATGIDLPKAGNKIPSAPTGTPPLIADINNATDAEIQAMIAQFNVSNDTLTENTTLLALNLEAVDIADTYNQQARLSHQNAATVLNIVDTNAEAILVQSLKVQGELSIAGLSVSQESENMLLQLLN